jgi:hypothetical protein
VGYGKTGNSRPESKDTCGKGPAHFDFPFRLKLTPEKRDVKVILGIIDLGSKRLNN